MSTPQQFAKQLEQWGAKLVLAAEVMPRVTASKIRRELAIATPKRTGRAAASWNASAGAPNYEVQPESYNDPNGAVDAGKDLTVGGAPGSSYYVSNAIPYIVLLNAGSSKQAPAGFIEQTVARFPLIAKEAVLETRIRVGLK